MTDTTNPDAMTFEQMKDALYNAEQSISVISELMHRDAEPLKLTAIACDGIADHLEAVRSRIIDVVNALPDDPEEADPD